MMIYPTKQGALRPGNYWRVVFKFQKNEKEWFPTIHLFDDEEEAKAKVEELNEFTGMVHSLGTVTIQKQVRWGDVVQKV